MRVQSLIDDLMTRWEPALATSVTRVLANAAFDPTDTDDLVRLAWCFWVYAPSVDPGREIALQLLCDAPDELTPEQWTQMLDPLIGHHVPQPVIDADRVFVEEAIAALGQLDHAARASIWQAKIDAASVDLDAQLARTGERLGTGDTDAAIVELQNLCERYPAHTGALLQLAMGLHQAKRTEEGLGLLQRASTWFPFHLAINQMLARFGIMCRKPDLALRTAQDILAASPFDADAHGWIARLAFDDPPRAIVAALCAQSIGTLDDDERKVLNDLITASPMDQTKISQMIERLDVRVRHWHALAPEKAAVLAGNVADRFRPISAPFRAMAVIAFIDAGKTKEAKAIYQRRLTDTPDAEPLDQFMARVKLTSQRPAALAKLLGRS